MEKLLILGNKITESRDLHWVCEKQTEGVSKNKMKLKGGRKKSAAQTDPSCYHGWSFRMD